MSTAAWWGVSSLVDILEDGQKTWRKEAKTAPLDLARPRESSPTSLHSRHFKEQHEFRAQLASETTTAIHPLYVSAAAAAFFARFSSLRAFFAALRSASSTSPT